METINVTDIRKPIEPETPSLANVAMSVITTVANSVSQTLCTHDYYRAFEGKRMLLRCRKCDHETPGWPTGKS